MKTKLQLLKYLIRSFNCIILLNQLSIDRLSYTNFEMMPVKVDLSIVIRQGRILNQTISTELFVVVFLHDRNAGARLLCGLIVLSYDNSSTTTTTTTTETTTTTTAPPAPSTGPSFQPVIFTFMIIMIIAFVTLT